MSDDTGIRLRRRLTTRLVADTIIATAAGLLVLILLAPTSGIDTQYIDTRSPECTSAFGYPVPCGWGLSVGAAVAAALVAAVVLTALRRRRR